ncbi:metallophosphoesterase family protein [Candidatus Acidulodesulfobacterium sp. H_13]|uniref:metallophosphoesterase family protein n=1 Tax=Candidatus Acidulodesulfobacterium sp. H_13 TaxID=3395470 RepID=UPI003AF9EBFF
MNICVAGDVHGRMDMLYESINNFELKLKIKFDVVLQVGDFGVWIDERNHDGTTKLYNGTGDFPEWYKHKRAVPIKTYFINGNNEDFGFLDAVKLSGEFEIIKDLFYISNGTVHEIKIEKGERDGHYGSETENIVVAGIGGKYDPEYFRHQDVNGCYTEYEIDNLINYKDMNRNNEDKQIDIFISHDAPEDVLIEDNDKNKYYPKSIGLRKLILNITPKVVFFGHHHGICESEIDKIPVYGLNILGEKGSFVAIKKVKDEFKILGRYP